MSGRWKTGDPESRATREAAASIDGEPSLFAGDAAGPEALRAAGAGDAGGRGSSSGAPPSSGVKSSAAPAAKTSSGSTPTPGATSGLPRARDSQPTSSRLLSEIPHAKAIHLSGNAPSFLDKLFATFVSLGSDVNLEEAVASLLGTFTEVFDDVAVGACIATESGEQLTIRRSPRNSQPPVPDPTRLFPEFEHEWIVELGDGSTLHVSTDDEAYVATVRDPSERLGMALRSLLERTRALEQLRNERRETEQLRLQVIHSEKLASLGQIAAGIVHELNNPLTSILAYSDYLRRDWEKRGESPADTERLRRISEAAERILAFTRDLIAYSRPSASVPGPVDIHEVLERALVFCEHVMTTSKVVVERRFGEEVRHVSGVAGQLTQVFVNLFTNAAQAMKDDGGTLLVSTEISEDRTKVVVHVSDEGHGIRDEHLPKVFEPYFTTKLDGGGTGLGLPIVQNIVKNHGGCISAKNREKGATFIVELPVSARVALFDDE